MFDEARFADDSFFESQALSTGTAAVAGKVLGLGNTEGGIRVHGWIEGSVACSSGNAITAKIEVGDDASSTASSDWTEIASNTLTASGTALSGDIISFIPDTGKKFMRVTVANSTGMTGKFSVRPEYVPR